VVKMVSWNEYIKQKIKNKKIIVKKKDSDIRLINKKEEKR